MCVLKLQSRSSKTIFLSIRSRSWEIGRLPAAFKSEGRKEEVKGGIADPCPWRAHSPSRRGWSTDISHTHQLEHRLDEDALQRENVQDVVAAGT